MSNSSAFADGPDGELDDDGAELMNPCHQFVEPTSGTPAEFVGRPDPDRPISCDLLFPLPIRFCSSIAVGFWIDNHTGTVTGSAISRRRRFASAYFPSSINVWISVGTSPGIFFSSASMSCFVFSCFVNRIAVSTFSGVRPNVAMYSSASARVNPNCSICASSRPRNPSTSRPASFAEAPDSIIASARSRMLSTLR